MIKVDLTDAEGRLRSLIQEAAAGEEVIITSAGGTTERLVVLAEAAAERGPSASLEPSNAVGHALDRFIGTWSAEQEAEILEAVEVFEQVDESFWSAF